ncbi:Ig domain-containing protein [Clostridium botulinum]|uniref:Ig-like domain-containing protein n=1 Tax=Clostridium sporogenes TaxID=1509 RepID=UPI002149ECB1|nr:Ig-like domain-containing protein [Clostridium sporogenes]MCR1972983.1 Ig-like domain-containing protein [Clostridium sporogenes]
MKKKIGVIMNMVLLFVFAFSGINNTYVAHAEKNNDFVIGTHNLNNTEKNSAKVGDKLMEPEIGWKRYDDRNNNISYSGNWIKGSYSPKQYYLGTDTYVNIGTPSSKNSHTISFNFIGSKIRILGFKNTTGTSNCFINIDGVEYKFSQNSNSLIQGCLSFEILNLKHKEHHVQIYSTNSDTSKYGVVFDAIDLDENGELKPYKEAVKAESITLDKTSMDLLEGSSDKLNAKILPEDATNKKVVWSSSDESIVKVDQEGKVTAIKEGKAAITAKVEGTDLTATCKVNVTKKVEENKNNAILSISLVNGATKEYDVSMQEVEKFINWFEERSNGKGPSLYSFNKKINPYKSVKEYIVHDKIASFEVREYEGTNK